VLFGILFVCQVFYPGTPRPVFYVASRGHHADIGGITPGSMPPHSTSILQEGAVFKSFKLLDGGIFQDKGKMGPMSKHHAIDQRQLPTTNNSPKWTLAYHIMLRHHVVTTLLIKPSIILTNGSQNTFKTCLLSLSLSLSLHHRQASKRAVLPLYNLLRCLCQL
jgi:hypothetical protein